VGSEMCIRDRLSISEQISANDVDLASGHRRRYFTTNKKQFTLSWSYLPDLVVKTVDNRSARNFLFGIVNTSAFATVGVELEPGAGFSEYECYVDSYSESLIRRDLSTGCTYYDVSLTLTER
jgi:hypothetical protein